MSGIPVPDIDPEDSATPGNVSVVRGNPSEEEIAAVAAVLAALFESGVHADKPRDIVHRKTRWQLSQRPMRGSLGDPWATFGR